MTNEAECQQLAELTTNAKRYLSRRVCAWCELPLHRPYCGAIYTECTPETRIKRRDNCLEFYKPRKPRKKG